MCKTEQLIGVSCIWPIEGPLISANQLELLKRARIQCVETGVRHDWETSSHIAHTDRLKAIIDSFQEAGITVWSIHMPFGTTIDISHPKHCQGTIELVSQYMEVCAQMGVDKVVVHPSAEPIEDHDRSRRIEYCVQSVKTLYRPDVAIALETLPRTCLMNTAEEVAHILALTEGYAGVCADLNHSHKDSITDMLRTIGDRLLTLHVSDDDGIDEKHWYPTSGVIDWKKVLDTLDEIGYQGCFLYEVRECHENPMAVRNNYEMLRSLS